MINNDRIVPVQKIDLLSLYATMLTLASVTFTVLQPDDTVGDFTVTGSGAAGNIVASQPVQSLDFATGVTTATVYFIAGLGFSGFTNNGVAVTPTGDVNPDGVTLYKAVRASGGAITITAVTPVVTES